MEQDFIDISVVIPTMNRVDVIGRAIDSVLFQSIKVREVIVVDDGSTDNTIEYLKNTYKDANLQIIKNEVNKGALSKVELKDLLGRNVLGGTSSFVVKRNAFIDVGGFKEDLKSCQDWDLWLRLAARKPLYCATDALVEYHFDGNNRISTNKTNSIIGHEHIFQVTEAHCLRLNESFRKMKAMHYVRMAEIHIKNLGQVGKGWTFILKSFIKYPSIDIAYLNAKAFAASVMFFIKRD